MFGSARNNGPSNHAQERIRHGILLGNECGGPITLEACDVRLRVSSQVASGLVAIAIFVTAAAVLAGCSRQAPPVQPEGKSPEETAFLAADAKLAHFDGQEFFGNTAEATERAEAFATMIKTFQHFVDGNARTNDASFEQVQGATKVLTYCEMRNGRIAFLAHVPELDRMPPSARPALLEAALSAASVAMIDLDSDTFTVAIGLRGQSGYAVVSTGKVQHDGPRSEGTEALHAFFGGEPFKGPSLASRRHAFEDSRSPDSASPPMLPGQPRGRHPSVGLIDYAGRTGMAVAIGPKIWVAAQHLVPANGPFAVIDASGRRRVLTVAASRGCEAYLQELEFPPDPYVAAPLARAATPASDAVLYGIDNGKPIATPAMITAPGTGDRGPLMSELQLGAHDLGRPLFDAQDRFVGLACNTQPKEPPQLMAVGDVRAYLTSQGITDEVLFPTSRGGR